MPITVSECIRRVKREIERTHTFPDSVSKRRRLEELGEMLKEYENQQAAGITEL